MRKIILGVFVLIVIGMSAIVFFIFYVLNQPCGNEPEKVTTIPERAFWSGDCDEGFWFEIVEINKVTSYVRIRAYNDYKGELAIDADFLIPKEYPELLSETVLKDNIVTYEEGMVLLKKQNYKLRMKSPAYGGYDEDVK